MFVGYDRAKDRPGPPSYRFDKTDRRVTVFYFYLWDDDVGPGFIKLCSYFPYPAKVWVNGHEWAKRHAARTGIGFTALANGFAACDDPRRAAAVCDRLRPTQRRAPAPPTTPVDETTGGAERVNLWRSTGIAYTLRAGPPTPPAWTASPPTLRMTIIAVPARLGTSALRSRLRLPPLAVGATTSRPPWRSSARIDPAPG